jgi:hypothetical protein
VGGVLRGAQLRGQGTIDHRLCLGGREGDGHGLTQRGARAENEEKR